MPAPAVAPWVRTRLRTAPGAAIALAVLVVLTSCLAAAFPRGVDTYEDRGLRHAVSDAPAAQSIIDVYTQGPGITSDPAERDALVRPDALAGYNKQVLQQIPDGLPIDAAQSSYGYRTVKSLDTLDPWLPKPYGITAKVNIAAQAGLPAHSRVVEGRLPSAKGEVTHASGGGEVAVTADTARIMHIKVGSVVHVPSDISGRQLAFTVTGIVEPLRPQDSYWTVQTALLKPALTALPGGGEPVRFWTAGLLLAPEAAPVLQATAGLSEMYWDLAPVTSHFTAHELDRLTSLVASLEGGPHLLKVRSVVGEGANVRTGLDDVFGEYKKVRESISPVVAVAAFGSGTVAAIVLLMAGGLAAARRRSELALLRSRGGSMAGICGRLAAETAVVVVPAAALGHALAVLAVPGGRTGPAVLATVLVAALTVLALPVRALVEHRRPQVNVERQDAAAVKPSRRRTVAELTLLVLAVGAVVALRRRGTAAGADQLVSAAPVLVGIIAALVLVRLYPLPLRWSARPAARLRAAVGFLSLARAGRSAGSGVLPLLALLTALTTTAFGGSVLAGIADARDQTAMSTVGADARVNTLNGVPAGLPGKVAKVPGVRSVDSVYVEHNVFYPGDGPRIPVVGVDPSSYSELARHTGLGPFPADRLTHSGGASAPLPVIASPAAAHRFGSAAFTISVAGYEHSVRIVAVRDHTPGSPSDDFLLVDRAGLDKQPPNALLITGKPDGTALRAAVTGTGAGVQLWSEERKKLADTPMQNGAKNLYTAAVAAGAGFAAVALLLALMRAAPERAALLARLRTMGLTRRQGRRLLIFEALPQALPAAVGGAVTGWAAIRLLASGVDLDGLAVASAGATAEGARLRPDAWSLAVPALCVVLLAVGVAALQAWWTGRRGSITELRAGDAR
ncbi:FtsX-like permease family protein [Streptomyces sp. NBC_01465]|uniref:FtsX-like permease family protein n=1 Tax=Streptomyces sp. NBC_01465 TaxID=2903878 RepID=UPI002E36357F|nr:FtsX-like permease family protein [Streptomyces sp. NBC_01465]